MMASANPLPLAILAVDVETRGENMIRNGLISIGYCLGKADAFKVIESGRFSMTPLPGQEYEKRCVDEFWSKYPEVQKTLELESEDAEFAIGKFVEKMRELEKQYDVIVVSDFPGFDIGYINYYLAYFGHVALQYHTPEFSMTERPDQPLIFRRHYDTDGYARGCMGMGYENKWTSNNYIKRQFGFQITEQHTHFPDDDARAIYEVHIKTILGVKSRKSKRNPVYGAGFK